MGDTTHDATAGDRRRSPDDAQYHARRAALYGYAATAFQFPDGDTVGDLTDDEVQAAVREAAAALDVGSKVEALLTALEKTDGDGLEAAYNDLFGLPGDDGTYPVVPYEAHYTTGEEVNESQRRIATVVGLLERFGLKPSDEFDERHDHVAVELELMQVVAAQRAVALEEGDDEAADRLAAAGATVLDEHLVDFVPAFSHRVLGTVDADDGPPDAGRATYAAAADLAATLVERDDAAHPEPVSAAPGVSADD